MHFLINMFTALLLEDLSFNFVLVDIILQKQWSRNISFLNEIKKKNKMSLLGFRLCLYTFYFIKAEVDNRLENLKITLNSNTPRLYSQ